MGVRWESGKTSAAKNSRKRLWTVTERSRREIGRATAKRALLKHQIEVLTGQFYKALEADQHDGMRKELGTLVVLAQEEGKELAKTPPQRVESNLGQTPGPQDTQV